MIEATFQAFCQNYENSPLPAMLEGFFLGAAPQGTTGNYAVFTPIAMVPEYDMSSHLELIPIHVLICTNEDAANEGASSAIRIGDWWMLWFDNAELDIGADTMIRIDKESHNLIQDPDGGWMYQIDYAILVQEA